MFVYPIKTKSVILDTSYYIFVADKTSSSVFWMVTV